MASASSQYENPLGSKSQDAAASRECTGAGCHEHIRVLRRTEKNSLDIPFYRTTYSRLCVFARVGFAPQTGLPSVWCVTQHLFGTSRLFTYPSSSFSGHRENQTKTGVLSNPVRTRLGSGHNISQDFHIDPCWGSVQISRATSVDSRYLSRP